MIIRQRILLRLLENEGGSTTKLRLTKLAFVVSEEAGGLSTPNVYDFLPYHRGPFSFTLFHELGSLQKDGLLIVDEKNVCLTPYALQQSKQLEAGLKYQIDLVSKNYQTLTTSALIAHLYERYPWYTLNSSDPKRRAVKRPKATCAVFTVGYEGLMVDGLLNLLLKHGIQQMIDVRSNPVARRYGFHRNTLERLCKDLSLEYVHIPSLGTPSDWRDELEGAEAYRKLFERYEKEVLAQRPEEISRAIKLLTEMPSAFMCKEADPTFCHRSRLAKTLSAQSNLPIKELRDNT